MSDPTTLNRLYGRRQGHKLRAGQAQLLEQLLPQIEVPGVKIGWHHTGQAFDAQEITVQLSDTSEIKDNTTLILSIGIQMGAPITDELVNPVKYGGCAKIIGVA